MTSTKPKGLDPRLERLTQRTIEELDQVQWKSGLVADVPGMSPTARVLVLLASDAEASILRNLEPSKLAECVYAVTVPITELHSLAAHDAVVFLEAGRQLGVALDTSAAEVRVDRVWPKPPTPGGFDGQNVVVGIIDMGFDYTHFDFRDEDGNTRVEFLWDQSLTATGGERNPVGFPYGVEYTRADIDAALASLNPFGIVRHRPAGGSHGTHVAGIAVGNGRSASPAFPAGTHVGMAPKATIIFVQPKTSEEAETFSNSVHVAEAIAYVFKKARELGSPCVINMSLGQNGGSHDGESVVERAIDAMLEEEGRAFVVAAGNEHVWCGHAAGTLATGSIRTLKWKIGGGHSLNGAVTPPGFDRTPNEMEIWYSPVDEISVSLIDPTGTRVGPVVAGDQALETVGGGVTVFVEHERFTRLNGEALVYIEVSPPAGGTIAPGMWQVEINARKIRDGRFDAWIERDVRDSSNAFADQSFFAGTSFEPQMTLGTPATTRRGIAVANYDHRPTQVEASSSRGPTRDRRLKPELAAPGTNIVASCALGASTGNIPVRVAKTGTSMAAPHVAGVVALMFQKTKKLSAAQVRGILVASVQPGPGLGVFDESWGYGMLDADVALTLTP